MSYSPSPVVSAVGNRSLWSNRNNRMQKVLRPFRALEEMLIDSSLQSLQRTSDSLFDLPQARLVVETCLVIGNRGLIRDTLCVEQFEQTRPAQSITEIGDGAQLVDLHEVVGAV